jgi:hypothetical protein
MRVVIRNYAGSGAKELFDRIEQNSGDIEGLLRGINGFVSYTLARAGDGGFSVTVCNDQTGIDESVQVAKNWIQQNAADITAAPPEITEGDVSLQL